MISGTSTSDTLTGGVQIQIQNTTGNKKWIILLLTGLTHLADPWFTISGDATWSFDPASVTFVSGNNYIIRSKAIDQANNLETAGIGISFKYGYYESNIWCNLSY